MGPLVSVLMPTFNRDGLVALSVESVLRQSYKNLELVVVDDGSTDGTVRAVEAVADDRVRIIRNVRNRGIAESRNIAVDAAEGSYFAWLDSDDIATPDRLEKQVAFLEQHPDHCLCCGNMLVIDETGTRIEGPAWESTKVPLAWELLWGNPIAQSSVMIRRSTYNAAGIRYDIRLAVSEDYDVWCKLASLGKMKRLEDVILHYRHLSDSAFHSDTNASLKVSALLNEQYVRDHFGDCPSAHNYCTSFAQPSLQEEVPRAKDIVRWFRVVSRVYIERFAPSRDEVSAIRSDATRKLGNMLASHRDLVRNASDLRAVYGYSLTVGIKHTIRTFLRAVKG